MRRERSDSGAATGAAGGPTVTQLKDAFRTAIRQREAIRALDAATLLRTVLTPDMAANALFLAADSSDAAVLLSGLLFVESRFGNAPNVTLEARQAVIPEQNQHAVASAGEAGEAAASAEKRPGGRGGQPKPLELNERVRSLYMRVLVRLLGGATEGSHDGATVTPAAATGAVNTEANPVAIPASMSLTEDKIGKVVEEMRAHAEAKIVAAFRTLTSPPSPTTGADKLIAPSRPELKRRFFEPLLEFASSRALGALALELVRAVDAYHREAAAKRDEVLAAAAAAADSTMAERDPSAADNEVEGDGPTTTTSGRNAGSFKAEDRANDKKVESARAVAVADAGAKKAGDPISELWERDYAAAISAFRGLPREASATLPSLRQALQFTLQCLARTQPLIGAQVLAAIESLASQSLIDVHRAGHPTVVKGVNNTPVGGECQHCHTVVSGAIGELGPAEARHIATTIADVLVRRRIRARAAATAAAAAAGASPAVVDPATSSVSVATPVSGLRPLTIDHEVTLRKFDAFCARVAALDPRSIVVDGANVGYFGLASWYKGAKMALLKAQGIDPESVHPDELDSNKRRRMCCATDVAPNFEILQAAIATLTTEQPGRPIVIFFHERHLTPTALQYAPANKALLDQWAQSDGAVSVVTTPAEANDDWCWMMAAVDFSARLYAERSDIPVFMVTNDFLRDHLFQLLSAALPGSPGDGDGDESAAARGSSAALRFFRWRLLHQIRYNVHFALGAGPDGAATYRVWLRRPPAFLTWPRHHTVAPTAISSDAIEAWHIPFTTKRVMQGTARVGIKGPDGVELHPAVEGEVRLPEQTAELFAEAPKLADGGWLCLKF